MKLVDNFDNHSDSLQHLPSIVIVVLYWPDNKSIIKLPVHRNCQYTQMNILGYHWKERNLGNTHTKFVWENMLYYELLP